MLIPGSIMRYAWSHCIDGGAFRQFNWTYDDALSSYLDVSYEKYSDRFQPVKIVDGYTYEHPSFTYGFTLNNKAYSASLHQDGKWLDPGFWALIDSAEKENNPAGRFYYIYPSDGLTVIYLTNEQYSFLRDHRLLEFTDPEAEEK